MFHPFGDFLQCVYIPYSRASLGNLIDLGDVRDMPLFSGYEKLLGEFFGKAIDNKSTVGFLNQRRDRVLWMQFWDHRVSFATGFDAIRPTQFGGSELHMTSPIDGLVDDVLKEINKHLDTPVR